MARASLGLHAQLGVAARDELAPLHSMTSSARASSPASTLRPSAFRIRRCGLVDVRYAAIATKLYIVTKCRDVLGAVVSNCNISSNS
jgi:hypothetical protein